MLKLPAACSTTILAFRSLFCKSVWNYAHDLLLGAILAPAQRTVTAVLRVIGAGDQKRFTNFHRVLNRHGWSPRNAARLLLGQILQRCVPDGAILIGLDDTIERRWGASIAARGIYRDPVRSSAGHFVKASGLRWLCAMVIVPLGFSRRRWALPVLSVLNWPQRAAQSQQRRHKRLPEIARGMLLQLKRWLPDRELICVADSSYAVIDLLAAVAPSVTMITRLRLDAALYAPVSAGDQPRRGRPRKKGERLPKLSALLKSPTAQWQPIVLSRWHQQRDRTVEVLSATAVWYHPGKPVVRLRWVLVRDPAGVIAPQAFLSTDECLSAEEILEYFLERWNLEVTFQESRAHLGVETQRQWSRRAIERTTPILLGLYSIVTLIGIELHEAGRLLWRQTAWYRKAEPSFSDVLAAVRLELWTADDFSMSASGTDTQILPMRLYQRLISTLCYGT